MRPLHAALGPHTIRWALSLDRRRPTIFVRSPSDYPRRAPRRGRDPPREDRGATPSGELFLSIVDLRPLRAFGRPRKYPRRVPRRGRDPPAKTVHLEVKFGSRPGPDRASLARIAASASSRSAGSTPDAARRSPTTSSGTSWITCIESAAPSTLSLLRRSRSFSSGVTDSRRRRSSKDRRRERSSGVSARRPVWFAGVDAAGCDATGVETSAGGGGGLAAPVLAASMASRAALPGMVMRSLRFPFGAACERPHCACGADAARANCWLSRVELTSPTAEQQPPTIRLVERDEGIALAALERKATTKTPYFFSAPPNPRLLSVPPEASAKRPLPSFQLPKVPLVRLLEEAPLRRARAALRRAGQHIGLT